MPIIFPDAANAFMKANAIQSNQLRNQLMARTADREDETYERQRQARAAFDPLNPDSALDAFRLDPVVGAQAQAFIGNKQEYQQKRVAFIRDTLAREAITGLEIPPEQVQAWWQSRRPHLLANGIPAEVLTPHFDVQQAKSLIQQTQTPADYLAQPRVGGVPMSQIPAGGPAPANPPGTFPVVQATENIISAVPTSGPNAGVNIAPGLNSPMPSPAAPAPAGPMPGAPMQAPAQPPAGGAQPILGRHGAPFEPKDAPKLPPGYQWGLDPRTRQWVPMSMGIPDKELVKINDPNSPTGERYVTRDQAGGLPPAKDATEGQANANLYAGRMQHAERIIARLEKAGLSPKDRAITDSINAPYSPIPRMAEQYGTSAQYRELRQAERDFLNAVLRRESGAVISPTEFAEGAQQYFPQPNDTKEILDNKRASRQAAIEGIRRAAQPGFGQAGPTGTPPPMPASAAPAAGAGNIPPPPPGFVIVQ